MAEPNPEELVLLGIKSYKEQDFSKDKGYFEKACDLNISGGCSNLGGLYYNGDGVKQDSKKAVALFEKACKLGHKKACEMLKLLR
ncbi:tetratricopeptide repeat protein [Helicobacter pylori]|uniref:tetratricopeptide repeat protein n=1 Tax=Helicobacter pylori TaxID=210 RepID=UPI0012B38123|nr:tetratricopeptide repeat protein [Helicobacter pylori]